MVKFEELLNGKKLVCIVSLGYVGLPLAVRLSKYFRVIGFDHNEKRVKELRYGHDVTNEVTEEEIEACDVIFSSDPDVISRYSFIIVAVPTLIYKLKKPDLLT